MITGIRKGKDGSIRYFNKEGFLHRENGPAVIIPKGPRIWFINGLRHRTDGPAYIASDGYKEWHIEGKQYEPLVWMIMTWKTNGL